MERPYGTRACCRNEHRFSERSFALRAQDFVLRPCSGQALRAQLLACPERAQRAERARKAAQLAWATTSTLAPGRTQVSEDGEGCSNPSPGQAVFVGTDSKRWWRSRLLTLSVGAGAKPAGISSAVVSRTRTTDLYALVDCSPVGICPTLAAENRRKCASR